jgi:PhnB protein
MALKLNPYLNFNGDAARAIQLYEKALGAKVESVRRFGDVPDMPTPLEYKERVMHAVLNLGDSVLMISDLPSGAPFQPGNNSYVCLQLDDVADATRKFDALSAGGTVTTPFQDMFWGAKFGTLIDAHGVNWMFNCTLPTK